MPPPDAFLDEDAISAVSYTGIASAGHHRVAPSAAVSSVGEWDTCIIAALSIRQFEQLCFSSVDDALAWSCIGLIRADGLHP